MDKHFHLGIMVLLPAAIGFVQKWEAIIMEVASILQFFFLNPASVSNHGEWHSDDCSELFRLASWVSYLPVAALTKNMGSAEAWLSLSRGTRFALWNSPALVRNRAHLSSRVFPQSHRLWSTIGSLFLCLLGSISLVDLAFNMCNVVCGFSHSHQGVFESRQDPF